MKVCGNDIVVKGRFIRIAQIDGDKYNFPNDPEALIDQLKKSGERIDLFTFIQKLPETDPKYAYPFEWDNLAVLPVSDVRPLVESSNPVPGTEPVRLKRKASCCVQVVCDEALAEGISAIYNESPVRRGKRFPHYGMTLESAREMLALSPTEVFL